MRKDKALTLKIIFTINGFLLIGIGIFILIKAVEGILWSLIVFGIILALLGIIVITFGNFVISESNKESLRTCEPGTIEKLLTPFALKYRGFFTERYFVFFDEKHQKHHLYFDVKARRLVFQLNKNTYLVNTIDSITSFSYEVVSENGICQMIKIIFQGLGFDQTLSLIKQPIKTNTKYYQEKMEELELLQELLS